MQDWCAFFQASPPFRPTRLDELDRIRRVYAERLADPNARTRYTSFNRADLFMAQERERTAMELLAQFRIRFSTLHVLDVGCGNGDQLAKFMIYGTPAQNLFGLDLLEPRLERARGKYPNLNWVCADGGTMPLADGRFDLLLQFTTFSSIFEPNLRRQMAEEMLRVVKPDGLMLWFDVRLHPANPQLHGIERQEIMSLFPRCRFVFRRIILAPPLLRLIAPYSLTLCTLLSQFWFLRTHYLVVIQPRG